MTAKRYTVGNTVYGINFSFDGIENISFRLPFMYDDRPIKAISIIPMEVMEHHMVPDSYSGPTGKKEYDGFILKGIDEVIWHNQYPSAHYGQLSDEGNRRFRRKLDDDLDTLIANEEVVECHLLTDVIRNIREGIKELSKPEHKDTNSERVKQLTQLDQEITKKFNDEFKKDFDRVAIWEKHPDIVHYVVIDLADESVKE